MHCYFRRGLDTAWAQYHFSLCAIGLRRFVRTGAEGKRTMRRIHSLLRAAPSRIGRRIADIVAIAAASLPVAGA
jgi:hypothetical protein